MDNFLITESAIHQLYARYADAVWRKDHRSFGDCFSEDAEWRIAGMVVRGRASISGKIKEVFPMYRWILFAFQSPVLTVVDGTVCGRAYVTERSVFRDGQAYAPIGVYYDRFIREDDQWKFSWRLFHTLYSGSPDLSGDFFENSDFGAPPGMPGLDVIPCDHAGVLKE